MAQAINGRTWWNGQSMDYVRFGSGEKTLVMIPGLSDGLRTVYGLARTLAFSYRKLGSEFTVYLFSRPNSDDYRTTREMAADLCWALLQLETGPVRLLGVSLGGMIAQYLALDYPQMVEKLVLTVTAARANDTSRAVVERWMELARAGDYRALMQDTAELSYTPGRARLYRLAYQLPKLPGRPDSFDRFLAQAQAILEHDAWDELPNVSCPTLIIGGGEDRIVGSEAAAELAARIPGSSLHVYPRLGHGAYEEAHDFQERVRDFCR